MIRSMTASREDEHTDSLLPALLGVENSFGGRRWISKSGDDRAALLLSQRLDVPDVIGRVLAARGVTLESAPDYLNPTLRTQLPDPAHLLDMDKAVARLEIAIRRGEKIGIFGDYDVDGATSSALLKRFLCGLGLDVTVHIPDRIQEGYGPNAPALRRMAGDGVSVVITVDCGVSSFEPLESARQDGLDVIVCDHHEAQTRLPEAVAIVDPKRLDESSPHTCLAAVGVAFLLCVGVNRALRDSAWYEETGRTPPDLMSLLDLVALGTVCDMVPLTGVNRALVRQGLKVIARRENTGLSALIEVARIRETITAFHLGFILGPRVNAGGRVGEAGMGAALLSCDDPVAALDMARHMDAWNEARKDIEVEVLMEAVQMADAQPYDTPLVFTAGEGWHAGVVGIVASRLKERYNRPACAVAIEGSIAKGSGRSVKGLDIGRAVIAALEAGLLIAGGGHAMAAGFTVETARLDAFQAFLTERLAQDARLLGDAVPALEIDGILDVRGANVDFIKTLTGAGPFGSGNPEPVFALASARLTKVDTVGQGHIRCFFSGPGGGSVKAMAFRAADSELGHALLRGQGNTFHVAGVLRLDTYGGRESAQFVLEDAAIARSN